MVKLIETKSDLDIKNELYRFLSGDYDSYFTPEQIKTGLEISFIFNYSEIYEHRLVFSYNEFRIVIPFDHILGLPPEQIKTSLLFWLKNDRIFKGALISFIRDYKINKLI